MMRCTVASMTVGPCPKAIRGTKRAPRKCPLCPFFWPAPAAAATQPRAVRSLSALILTDKRWPLCAAVVIQPLMDLAAPPIAHMPSVVTWWLPRTMGNTSPPHPPSHISKHPCALSWSPGACPGTATGPPALSATPFSNRVFLSPPPPPPFPSSSSTRLILAWRTHPSIHQSSP